MEKATVFGVYGTLKQGGSNHELLEHPNVEYLGNDATRQEFTMIDMGAFPAIVPLGTTAIRLEVYQTDDKWILERLNQLEGFKGEDNPNNLYDFVQIKTQEFSNVHVYQMKLTHPWIEKRKGVVMNGNWQIARKEEPKLRFNQPMAAPRPMKLKEANDPFPAHIRVHNQQVDELIEREKIKMIKDPVWKLMKEEDREAALNGIEIKFNAKKIM